MFYHSGREYLDFVCGFVADGVALGVAVLVAVPAKDLALLRDAVRGGRDRLPPDVRMADITDMARNPGRFMAAESSFADEHPGRRVRIVSQLAWPGRTDDELVACVEHEALVNVALEGYRATGVCLYDAQRPGEGVLSDARAAHPLPWSRGALHRNGDYAPQDVLQRCNRPLTPKPGPLTYVVRRSADLRPARSFAVRYAGSAGLSQDGIDDLQLIARELATNSLMYTDGACRLAFWQDDQHLVCEARHNGRLEEPLAGRLDPGANGPARRGPFLVNAMSDSCVSIPRRTVRPFRRTCGLIRRVPMGDRGRK